MRDLPQFSVFDMAARHFLEAKCTNFGGRLKGTQGKPQLVWEGFPQERDTPHVFFSPDPGQSKNLSFQVAVNGVVGPGVCWIKSL